MLQYSYNTDYFSLENDIYQLATNVELHGDT